MNFSFNVNNGKTLMCFISKASQKENGITIEELYAFIRLSKSRFDDFHKVINAAADFNKVAFIFESSK